MDIANPKLKLHQKRKPLLLIGGGVPASALIAGSAACMAPTLLGAEGS